MEAGGAQDGFGAQRRGPRWGTLAVVVALHALAIAGLVRAFAPDLPALAIERAVALVSVPVTPTPPPEPEPTPPRDPPDPVVEEGAAAPEAPQAEIPAEPREVAAPVPRIVVAPPISIPTMAASGDSDAAPAGAGEQGTGRGAGGEGAGTGSGRGGSGRGGAAVVQPPVKIAGDISDARDFPAPPGGRQIRKGQHVIVRMTVGVDGRARDCRVIKPSPDPVADRITCRLAEQRFRFRPARDQAGNPVPAPYGWRQDWF